MEIINIKKLRKDVHKALRAWHQTGGSEDDLLDYLRLVQMERERTVSPSRRLATNTVLQRGIGQLNERDRDGAKVLRSRFQDQLITQQVANQFNNSVDHINRLQRGAIEQLSAILMEEEGAIRREWIAECESRLPPKTYTNLIGVEEKIDLITEKLQSAETNTVAICGIGGIGKTSIAQAATRHLIRETAFEAFIWLRVDPAKLCEQGVTAHDVVKWVTEDLVNQLLPEEAVAHGHAERLRQVQQALDSKPHLVVLDNFESHVDISLLLTYLLEWGGVSKFLLTTRVWAINPVGTFHIMMEELAEAQSAELICDHAKSIPLPELEHATAEQTAEIHAAVGGNPLALKLVVGLAAIMPLPRILRDLVKQKTGKVDDMYRYIYFQTWKVLSENAKNLLQAMALVTDSGGTVEHLLRISKLDEELFWAAIPELVSRSLLEVRGTTFDRRYSCHRLTTTFLRRDILGWEEDV